MTEEDLVYRLKKRAEIRRSISTRKSVQGGKPDRIADLLEEAAAELEHLHEIFEGQVKESDERLVELNAYRAKYGAIDKDYIMAVRSDEAARATLEVERVKIKELEAAIQVYELTISKWQEENQRLREALEWYAKFPDDGHIARAALKEKKND